MLHGISIGSLRQTDDARMEEGLFEKSFRLAEGLGQVIQEHGGAGAVGDAVVAGDGHSHHGPDGGLAVNGGDAVSNAPDSKDCSLRRRDDRAELVNLIHAEIADGESGVGDVGGTKLAGAGSVGDFAALLRDLGEAGGLGIRNYGGDYAIIHSDSDAHVHVIVKMNTLGAPAGV